MYQQNYGNQQQNFNQPQQGGYQQGGYQQGGYQQQTESSDSLKEKLKTVKEELVKISAQKGQIEQKQIEIKTGIEGMKKKLIQVQNFPQNFPHGTQESIIQQQQQYNLALQQLSQSLNVLNEKEVKYNQFIDILNTKITESLQNEKDATKRQKLQKASSLSFQPDFEIEKTITVPDYVVTQIDGLLRQNNINGANLNITEKLISLLQSSCPLDKSLRMIMQLSTDKENQIKIVKTRLLPILLNILKMQNLDESYKKNILWLLCSLSTNEDAKHCLAKVGIIPIAVDYMKSNSSSNILIDHSLTILSNILIEDTYQTIFQHCDGVKFLLDFFSSGTVEQQALALNIFSIIGFSEEEDAASFVSKRGNISALTSIIDNDEQSRDIQEKAIRIIISLTKIVPDLMVDSGNVSRVIKLVNTEIDNLPIIRLCLDAIGSIINHKFVQITVQDLILDNLVFLLDSNDSIISSNCLSILEKVFNSSMSKPFEKLGGLQKLINIFCSYDTKQDEIENVLSIISSMDRISSQGQSEFFIQGGIDIVIKFLITDDKILIKNALSILSLLHEHYSTILTRTKGAKLFILPFENEDDESIILSFLSSMNNFSLVNNDNNLIKSFIDSNIIPILLKLLSHFDNLIILNTLKVLYNFSQSILIQSEIINENGTPFIIKTITSNDEEIRHESLKLISYLCNNSNRFKIEFAQNQLIPSLNSIFPLEKIPYILSIIRSFASDNAIQIQTIKTGILDQILRHLRSKDLQFMRGIIETLNLLSKNNITVLNYLISNQTQVYIIRLLETLFLRAKVQLTDGLCSLINIALSLLINLCVCGESRFYLMEKTTMKITLKKFQELRDHTLKKYVSNLQTRLQFPYSENDICKSKKEYSDEVNRLINETKLNSNNIIPNNWDNLLKPINSDELFAIYKVNYESLNNNDKQNEIKLNMNPNDLEEFRITNELKNAEEDLCKYQERYDSIISEIESIKQTMEKHRNEILLLQELGDELLIDELEKKKQDYIELQGMLSEATEYAEAVTSELEESQMIYNNSKKELIEFQSNNNENLKSENNNNNISSRLKPLVKLYVKHQQFLANIIRFKRGFLDILTSKSESKLISLDSDDFQLITSITNTINEILSITNMTFDKLENYIQNDKLIDKIEIGKLLLSFIEYSDSFKHFGNQYKSICLIFEKIMKNNELIDIINPMKEKLSMKNIAIYPMLVLYFIWDIINISKELLSSTEVDHIDHRSLNAACRKFDVLQKSLTKEQKKPTGGVIQLKQERYRALVAFLNDKNFSFLDIYGELKVSEKIINELVRLFAAQGLSSIFLEHQIEKEVTETVGQSTLFRGQNFAAQALSSFAHNIGGEYLLNTLAIYLRQLHNSGQNLEVNHLMLENISDANDPKVIQQQILLRNECEKAFSFINGTADQCPTPLKNVCNSLRKIVATRFPSNDLISVGGLFFLRYICPCFVTPERFNICSAGSLDKEARRNCILVSKVLQNLSNSVKFGMKEPFMLPLNSFLDDYTEKMKLLLSRLSNQIYPEESMTSLLKPDDLFTIHSNLYENKDAIKSELDKAGAQNILRDFENVLKDLGPPISDTQPQQTTQSSSSSSSSQRKSKRFSKFISKRKMSDASLNGIQEIDPKPMNCNIALLNQLSLSGFLFPQGLWQAADFQTGESICKSLVRIHDRLGCGVDCVEVLIKKEVQDNCNIFILLLINLYFFTYFIYLLFY